MYPVLFNIEGFAFYSAYIFMFLFVIVYIFSFWMITKKLLKPNTIFDISLITIMFSVFTARFVGMLANLNEYLEAGWSLFPLSEAEDKITFATQLPWVFLRFLDGNISYVSILFGFILGMMVIYKNSNQKKTVFVLFDHLVISFAISSIFLYLGLFLHGANIGVQTDSVIGIAYPDGITRYPIQILQIVITLILLFSIFVASKSNKLSPGVVSGIFFIIFGVFELLSRAIIFGYQPTLGSILDVDQVISLLVIIIGVLIIADMIFLRRKHNVSREGLVQPIPGRTFAPTVLQRSTSIDETRRMRAEERIKAGKAEEQAQMNSKSSIGASRFMMSFGDRFNGRDEEE